MDLVEAFGARTTAHHGGLDFMERVESGASGDVVIIDAPAASAGNAETPQLFIDTTIRQASRGRGAVTCVAASNDVVLVATARGYLLRYCWDENGNEQVKEVEVVSSRPAAEHRISALFMDPGANHVLMCVRGPAAGAGGGGGGGGAHHAAEVYYVHRRWPRAKVLTELRAAGALTAVAWCIKQPGDDGPTAPAVGGGGVGFGGRRAASSTAGSTAGDSCTGAILLGYESGTLQELVLDERQKREAPPKTLIEGLPATRDRRGGHGAAAASSLAAFTSLYQIALPNGRKALLATTLSHLRIWVAAAAAAAATSPWQALFLNHSHHFGRPGGAVGIAAAPPPVAVLEAVAPSPCSQLQLWWPLGLSDLPTRFAWLVGGVVYHGDLDWEVVAEAPTEAAAAAAGGASEVMSRVVMLPVDGYGSEADGDGHGGGSGLASCSAGDGGGARSLMVTEYHLLLLARDRLRLVNRVNGRTVVERAFRSPLTRSVTGEPSREIDGLVRDLVSGTTYMAVDEALYDVTLQHEDRGMWRVYLEMKDWDAALRCCSGPAQRDEVHRARAEAALAVGDFRTAAVHFAKVTDGRPPFEDVALQLADCGDPAALQTFLGTRLSALAVNLGGGRSSGGASASASASAPAGLFGGGAGGGAADGHGPGSGPEWAQCTLISAWLTELYLDAINRALLEAGGEDSEAYRTAVNALQTHLSDWVHVMDAATTVALLESYGRLDELLQLARLRGDHEGLLELLVARPPPGGAKQALIVLRSPAVSRELVYKFAPGLVAAAAEEAVDFFIAQRPPLDPRRLLPALLRLGEPDSPAMARRHVLRYVEFAIEELGTTDSVVHNLAVALYSLEPGEEGEAALLRYLTRAGRGGANLSYGSTTPLYDTQYALRLAQECNKPRAAVRLMCQLGMYPDAVRAALAMDLGLAKNVAGEPEHDDALRRKLWLQVARHVVESGSKVAAASGGESGGGADPTGHIRTAVDFLREADGLLRIEDILPFFPDFVTIDNFQAAICDSLERYGAAIESLKADMEEATAIAEDLRTDISRLASRSAVVSLSQPCVRCGRPIAEPAPLTSLPQGGSLPPFYVFPTGCAYHTACCASEVTELVAPQQRRRIYKLLARLSKVPAGAITAPKYGSEDPAVEVAALQEALAAEIGCEDPRNGELTVRLLEAPFVFETDRAEAESWRI